MLPFRRFLTKNAFFINVYHTDLIGVLKSDGERLKFGRLYERVVTYSYKADCLVFVSDQAKYKFIRKKPQLEMKCIHIPNEIVRHKRAWLYVRK